MILTVQYYYIAFRNNDPLQEPNPPQSPPIKEVIEVNAAPVIPPNNPPT